MTYVVCRMSVFLTSPAPEFPRLEARQASKAPGAAPAEREIPIVMGFLL